MACGVPSDMCCPCPFAHAVRQREAHGAAVQGLPDVPRCSRPGAAGAGQDDTLPSLSPLHPPHTHTVQCSKFSCGYSVHPQVRPVVACAAPASPCGTGASFPPPAWCSVRASPVSRWSSRTTPSRASPAPSATPCTAQSTTTVRFRVLGDLRCLSTPPLPAHPDVATAAAATALQVRWTTSRVSRMRSDAHFNEQGCAKSRASRSELT